MFYYFRYFKLYLGPVWNAGFSQESRRIRFRRKENTGTRLEHKNDGFHSTPGVKGTNLARDLPLLASPTSRHGCLIEGKMARITNP
jgi:hypothetical protein